MSLLVAAPPASASRLEVTAVGRMTGRMKEIEAIYAIKAEREDKRSREEGKCKRRLFSIRLDTDLYVYVSRKVFLPACGMCLFTETGVFFITRLQNQKCRLSSTKVSPKMSQRDQKYTVQSHAIRQANNRKDKSQKTESEWKCNKQSSQKHNDADFAV